MPENQPNASRRALLSVSNKDGLIAFAQSLRELGFEIISTGGTAAALSAANIPVLNVSDVTGFPEMLEGRVKTLHPGVHGGLLADRSKPEHLAAIAAHHIMPIDLLCVNLYPFAATIAKPDVTLENAIENIDIGGPAMIRSAAKNHNHVLVVVDPADYAPLIAELQSSSDGIGQSTLATRRRLAAKAFTHTAQYDTTISQWLTQRFAQEEQAKEQATEQTEAPSADPGTVPAAQQADTQPDDTSVLPSSFAIHYSKAQDCRYGENPHQQAAFYVAPNVTEPCVANARQIWGKELSFNNIYDLNGALETVKEFSEEDRPAAVIIKHTNPCGAALGDTLADAFQKARLGDPISAFGGILAVTRILDVATAEAITGKNTFFEAIIAPGYEAEAIPILKERKAWGANLRLLEVADLRDWRDKAEVTGPDFKRVTGGVLVQTPDHVVITPDKLEVVTERAPTPEEIEELLFAWRIVRHVKSNAIVFTKARQVVGVGAGQMNRVRSVKLAVEQAGEQARGAVMGSDAFFPFPDGPEAAAAAGITAIIQPGGSKKDQETIDVCNKNGIAMVYTGIRHFLH